MILDWLFKRSKKVKNKEAIAPVFVDVPTREDLIKNNQTEMIKLLEQYKKEYKEKLKGKLLFGDISSENLSKKYLENQDIIIRHILNNNYTSIDQILASGNTEELLEAKLEYLKLYILNEENNKIHNEMLLRYMALTEIKKKAYFIRPTQRRAILNELDFLHNSLVVCKSNNFATNTDCKLYLIRMNEINRYMNKLSNDENKLLNERKRLITKLANTFIKDKYDSILSSNMSDLGIVSYLEIELEKYYLSHQEDFKYYKLEVLPKTTISDKEDVKQLLEGMEELEAKYLLRNMFNKIDEYMFLRMYKLKFIILTHKINCFGNSVISKEDYGYEYYKKIVNEKLDFILNGYNENFNKLFSNAENYDSAKDIVKKMFFDIEGLLNSGFKLAILLSFDNENGFEKLLSSTMINKDTIEIMKETYDYNVGIILSDAFKEYKELYKFYFTIGNSEESYIKWDDTIPLKSILEGYNIKSSNLLIEMYWKTNLFEKNPKLPVGIKELGILHSPIFRRNYVDWYMENLSHFKNMNYFYPIIILPNSIRVFKIHNNSNNFFDIHEFPYGITEIDICDSHIPPIPPTVEKIEIRYSYSYYRDANSTPVITFLDFKNSKFLRKKENIIALLRSLIGSNANFHIKLLAKEDTKERIIICDKKTFSYIINDVYYKEKTSHIWIGREGSDISYFNHDIAINDIADKIMSELSTTSHKQEMSQSLCKQNIKKKIN